MVLWGKDFLRYPPTLIVEILSEATRFKDRHTKLIYILQQGVKYYLLADTDKETIEIFELKNKQYHSGDSSKPFDFGKCKPEIRFDSVFQI